MKIKCPECTAVLNVDDSTLNGNVQCSKCKHIWLLDPNAKVRCPSCAEEILAIANKCRYCGENLVAEEPPPKKKQPVVLIVILSLIIIGIFIWILYGLSTEGKAALPAFIIFTGGISIFITILVISAILKTAKNTEQMAKNIKQK